MKKWMCALLALALACLATAALAEAADPKLIERFEDVWVDGDVAVEIWYDEGSFHCSAVLGDGDDAGDVWEYASCAYDPDREALVCSGGARYAQTHDAGGELISRLEAENLTAEFAFDAEDRLVWTDSEGLCGGYALRRLFDAEEEAYWKAAGAFEGTWQCGRATMEISPREDDFMVLIYWGGSASETAEWVYTCQYDDATNTLASVGEATCTVVTYGADGELISAEEQYNDGAAVFRFDRNGCLVWDDLKENRGDGMTFERLDAEAYDESGAFVGRWAAGRCSIEITPDEDAYRVFVQWGNSAADSIEWTYTCLYDEELGGLVSVGEATKADVFYDQGGDIADTELFYSDGLATFTLNGDGRLLWHDQIEDAGADMAFERMPELD